MSEFTIHRTGVAKALMIMTVAMLCNTLQKLLSSCSHWSYCYGIPTLPLILRFNNDPCCELTKVSIDDAGLPKCIGWERNEKNKLMPKVVNLSSSMDPVRYAYNTSTIWCNTWLVGYMIYTKLCYACSSCSVVSVGWYCSSKHTIYFDYTNTRTLYMSIIT